jgi:hypothetical protein
MAHPLPVHIHILVGKNRPDLDVVLYSEFLNRNINKSHNKITCCYFLAMKFVANKF